MKNTESNTIGRLHSFTDNELRIKGIQLLEQGVLAIRQLSSEDYNSKVKEDFVFQLSDSIYKLPSLLFSTDDSYILKNRPLIENEMKLAIKAFETFNGKFPHRRISF